MTIKKPLASPLLACCVALLAAGRGRHPVATGQLGGRVEVGGGEAPNGVVAADLRLRLTQHDDGSVEGEGGRRREVDLGTVNGRADGSGEVRMTATDDEFPSGAKLDLQGELTDRDRTATLTVKGILAESVAVGDFELVRL